MGKIRQFEDGYSDPDSIALSYQTGRNRFWEVELALVENQYAEVNNRQDTRSQVQVTAEYTNQQIDNTLSGASITPGYDGSGGLINPSTPFDPTSPGQPIIPDYLILT